MAAEDLVCENDPFQATRTKTTAKGLRVKTTKTSPDVTMSRNATTTNWKTENNVQSDHNWIKFTVDNVESLSPTKRKFWCLKKAKWTSCGHPYNRAPQEKFGHNQCGHAARDETGMPQGK